MTCIRPWENRWLCRSEETIPLRRELRLAAALPATGTEDGESVFLSKNPRGMGRRKKRRKLLVNGYPPGFCRRSNNTWVLWVFCLASRLCSVLTFLQLEVLFLLRSCFTYQRRGIIHCIRRSSYRGGIFPAGCLRQLETCAHALTSHLIEQAELLR